MERKHGIFRIAYWELENSITSKGPSRVGLKDLPSFGRELERKYFWVF
jgi:hypothetical protein